MGGIIDTWVTLFQSDTSSVEEGNKKAADSADDLIARLKDTDSAASGVGDSMKDMIKNAAAAFVGFMAAKATIGGVFEDAEAIVALNQTAEALGETIEQVDAFGKAAAAMGGDAQGARDSLTDLSEKMGEAASDAESGAAKGFKALGISLKDAKGETKGAIEGILDLAGAVEKLPKNEAIFKIKELGLTDNRTVEMVLKGRKELERLMEKQKEQGVITKENAEQAMKFKLAWGELTAGFERAGFGISTTLMPYFTKAIEVMTKGFNWLEDNKDIVTGFFIAIGAAVAYFYLPAMVAAAAATLAATWPIIAIGAVVVAAAAAFALLYDDVMNFIDGNDSFIGQMAEKYPMVKSLIDGIATAFKFLGQMGEAVWRALTLGFDQMLGFIMRGIKQISEGVSTVASFFGIGSDKDAEEQKNKPAPTDEKGRTADDPDYEPPKARPSGSGQASSDVPMIDAPEEKPRALPSGSGAPVKEGMAAGRNQLAAAAASPLNSTSSNAITNSNTNNKSEISLSVGEINVNAPQATDASGIAASTTGALDKQLQSMQDSSANGRAL